MSVYETLGILAAGGAIVIPRAHELRDPAAWAALCRRHGVTLWNSAPALLGMLADHAAGQPEQAPAGLRLAFVGGDWVPVPLASRVRAWAPALRDFIVMGGATEASIHSIIFPVDTVDPAWRSIPYGVPMANQRARILDPHLREVPAGIAGELFLGGIGLARGYVGRAGFTAERFLPDPHAAEPGTRMYRTGDLARYLEDGTIELLGRIDHQLKVRGFRIEPGEVEAVLNRHPAVARSAVAAHGDTAGERRVVAYVVPDPDAAPVLSRLLELQATPAGKEAAWSELPNGLPVAHLNPNETEFSFREVWEEDVYLRHGITVEDGDCVFDVGANIGLFTLLAARRAARARVFAFEPIPPVFEVLRLNAALHGVDARLFNCGLAREKGSAGFTYYPHVSIVSGQFADGAQEMETIRTFLRGQGALPGEERLLDEAVEARLERESFTCTLRTLSDVVREHGVKCIDLLKVDAEKAEEEVLAGIADEDWPKIRQVVVEVFDRDGRLARVRALLERHGFVVAEEADRAMEETAFCNLYARRPEDTARRRERGGGRAEEPGEWVTPQRLVGSLREHARRTLPDYMVPAAYVLLDRLPLSGNGKVDRRQLPAPPAQPGRAPYQAPASPTEAALAEIWAEVLRTERVGARDDFFALGGHSLAAARVVARLRERMGVQFALGEFFRVPTLADLAAAVDSAGAGATERAAAPIPRVDGDGPFPLAPAQRRLWLWEQMNPGQAAYNVPVALRLRGPVRAELLEPALDALVRRHPALRTLFAMQGGEPVQRILPEAPLTLRVDEAPSTAGADAWVRRRLAAEGARPFDLATGPLFRTLLLRGGEEQVLLLTLHHVVGDGWSVGILLRELGALYDAFSRGEPSPLAPLPLRYADYAVWHRERLARVEAAQLEWWRVRLAGAPTLLELPTDRPRPAVQGHRGAQHPVRLAAALVERARALGREEGATLHMVLLAALDAVLARHARAGEVVVGSVPAGRTHPDTEALVGFFVNTLPIRADLSRDPSFRALVRQVREHTLEAYDHQDVPFDRLVEALSPARSRSHAPLVQVAVAFQDAPARGLRLGQARAEAEWVDLSTAQFDLTWLLDEDEHGVAGVLEYATDLFDAATAARIADRFRVLLEAAVSAPERRVSTLPLVDAAERERVLRAWSGTGEAFPVRGALHHRFEARAAARPEAAALTCDVRSLSYGVLNARANRLARRLARLGVGPEARVGVCAGRGPELVAGILAVLKAGGAYVPLDPAYPAERLAYMAEDAGIRVLLAGPGVAHRFAPDGVAVVSLDEKLAAESSDDLGVDVDPANLAYVIYTSGSTGRPKGVGVTHGNVLRLFASTNAAFGFGADDVWTLFHSCSFDFSVWELWGALLHGGRLVVVPDDVSRDPVRFRELLRGEGVTVLNQTPSAFRALARADERQAEPLERLRTVVFGGEALQYESLRGWLDRYGPRRPRLVNMYGITETTVHVTRHVVTGAELRQGAVGSGIGTPIADLRTYVLDPAGEPAPIGVPGELHVGGAGLARSYLGRPGLTAQRFIPDPFSGEAGARLYRSGDLARWRADGTLEYRGRIDQQVKVRGFRIEPGEIESLLLAHPGVSAAAVVVRGEGDEAALAAYVVPAAGAPPSAPELRDALRKHLPEHMVPAAFVALDRIPLTANGKLDRAALPAAADAPGDGQVAPRTPVEAVLAAIWCEVLRRERVGVTENFFELGGHSLLATRMAARIPELFGVELSVAALFEAPTVAELATRVEALRQAGRPVPPPVARVERAGPAPLSFAQERLWFLHRLQPESAFYNVTAVVRLSGALDAVALERALGEVVRRHEPLRTTFREMDGAPVQVVVPFAGFALPVEAVSGPDEAERRVAEEAERPFDLSAGPLFRPSLLRLGDEAHVLLLCMHHVVSDEWSTEVLFRELAAAYAAYRQGGEPHLPELPVRYTDFAAWQREHMRGEALERRLAWWRERLDGAPAMLELPTDRPRPAVQSFRGATLGAEFPGALRARLEALGRGEGATPYMVLLAAFQVLLARYSGSDDVVVGSPAAGQTRREVQELVGFFTNTLVLRTDLSGDPAFREVLRRVREATLGAYEHQEVPFERLVAELQPERSPSYSPLFQVAFVLADADRSRTELPGLEMRREYAESATSKFDLTLEISESETGLRASVGYSTDLFERGTIERMLVHLARVLEQVAADPDVRLSRVELIGPDERHTLIEAWNQTGRPYPRGVGIHELFAAQVRAMPGAEALVWGDTRLTYAELDARANQLAHHLARRGVGPESRVGVLLERGVELIVSILAVLKAGGCYVPLDSAYPAERLELMLADAGVRVLLTRRDLASALDAREVACVYLDESGDALAAESSEAPRNATAADSLAYIVYTSGSTGRPKGVMVAHRHVVQLVRETDFVRLGPGDRVAQASNASFDALTFEAWGALLNGATLVGIDRDVLLSAPALREALREQGITTLYQTTALLNQLSREQPDVFAPLRDVLFGGQAADADSVRRIVASGKPQRLIHVYGPTETTAWCSWHDVWEVAVGALTVSIGRPTGNQRIYILDAALQPVPIGVPGEAYVGGDGVVRGYLDRPGLTAERFVPDPFAAEPGARMYRTGDRLRWKADGTLEFVGRLDDQVKIRGFRIEPGEVESVLCAHPEVREARVVVREDEPGEKRLVGYVVGEVGGDELRDHLRQSLPEYMVPAAFVALESLPLTAVGKLDVKALPAPDLASAGDRYVALRTPVEEVLAGIWGELLRLERVGAHDDFFALGGHSLLATRVVSRIRTVFSVELPLRAIFERPTVAELADAVEALRRAGLPILPPVVPVGRDRPLPLSFAQERLWFLDRMEPGSTTYNMNWAIRLSGSLEVAALERALGEIVRRQEALRTTFGEMEGAPAQVIAPFEGFVLPVDDISRLPEAEREAEVRRRATDETARPFDLSAGPLFRAALLRLGDEEHVLLLGMHHVVSDGWSLGVLQRELSALYAAYREGAESPLAELPVQYADYAVWQREQVAGDLLDRQLAYWTDRLADAPALLELPTDHPRPAVQAYHGAFERVELPAELLERLRALGRAEGATLYMVLLGAFQVLLSRYGGGGDVVVGSPIAGRSRGEVEELVGFFVNTLALRTGLSGDPGFREVLRRVRETTLGAWEHQELPFERLVAKLQPERSLGYSPLFQVTFALDDAVTLPGGLPGLRSESIDAELGIAKFDLALSLEAHAGGLGGTLGYRTGLFERGTIVRMLGHLARVLEQVAADADVRLSRLELLAADERRTLIEAWNQTGRPYPRGVCIHELFEAQVRATPGTEALVWGDTRLTYAELDARANRLAHHFARRGVGPESRVGVLLERGLELIVSILAILKAGGCYVPLDPAYPAERLELMLADAGVRVLLTRRDLASALDAREVAFVCLDESADALAAESVDALPSRTAADSLAYIVYTSGSTGRPKGVMVAHRHVVQLVRDTDYVQFGPGDRVAQASNASFDALTFEVWGALLNGATLVGIDRDVLLSPPSLRECLRAERITTLYQTTALLNQLSREQPDIFSPLREVLFGGQASDADRVRALLKAGKPRRLVHVYGPTETTAWCSWEQVEAVDEDALTVSVGRPTGNQRIYVLDATLNPVPVGVPGEAFVGGDGVVRGYLDRPGLTAARFVPDPFTSVPGARMYRTGDRLRWKADGKLEFAGRIDDQVKIRGFRIEPGEVENVLASHPGVAEARVIVREDEPGETRLVGYVVGDAEPGALIASLRRSLPEYMVPAAIVTIDRLPLTANGKLDVKAVPAPELASADEYVAPRTPAEEVMAGIWAEVLRIERIGTADDFFRLGGHSLLATRVVSRIRTLFGVELPLRTLFERPTIAGVADAVEALRRDGTPALPPVVPVGRDGALRLSFAQERLWFLDRMAPGSTTYNMALPLRLTGALDVAALERALGEIVRRHEALRTTFADAEGGPVQVIAPFAGFALPATDLSDLPGDERDAAVGRRVAEEMGTPYVLAAGPLFRAALLRFAADEHVLVAGMHHAVSDGWSLGVLLRELSALYGAFRDGAASPLADLPVQYADFAAWQRERLAGDALERQLAWWREGLAGAPALLELPTDHPRPAVQAHRGGAVPVEVDPALLERLRALGRGEGTTLFMVVLGAFQLLLSKYGAGDDVVVGTAVAGRARGEVEPLIGFFVNTLALRTRLSGDPDVREVLRRVRETTLGAFEHQDLPFEKLVAELRPERSQGHAPLVQVMFTLDDAAAAPPELAGLRVAPVQMGDAAAKFDLTLALAAAPDGLRGALAYDAALFERETVERMAAHLARVLAAVAADPAAPAACVELMDDDERRAVLHAWNPTATPYPASGIARLFEEQAARTPGALALACDEGSLTYAALNERANRLAHHLLRRGVRAESRVGVCLPRGPEAIAAVLATLKAGGAYVPLDPAYPAERLAFMLADAEVAALVTDDAAGAALPASPGIPVVHLDRDAAEIAACPATDPRAVTGAEHLAYVIYTSGSTGMPKGVAVEQRAVVRLVRGGGYAALGPDTVMLQAAPLSFDASTFEVWGALLNGGTVVPVPGANPSLEALGRAITRHGVNTLWLTAGLLQAMVEERADDLAGVRQLLSGGDVLPAAQVAALLRRVPGCRVINGYGPTENTTFTACHTVPAGWTGGPVPIGTPIANTRAWVLDAALRPVPAGAPGELFAAGDGVARGYLGRPALTAERFVPDPYSGIPGARMYRTGDRVRWHHGVLEFLGRLDAQVKIRGFRIEPGEVQRAIAAHPGVREACVAVRGDAGEKRLIAWISGDADPVQVREALRRRLPEYMLPAAVVAVEHIPLTANGKVDVGALPAPEPAGDGYVAPRTPAEEVLAAIWAEVLRRERVGVEDDFFALGGHSLLATRVVSRIRAAFGVELPLRTLFEQPSVAGLAAAIEALRRDGAPALPPVVPVERDRPLPLTFGQERLWFLDRMQPGNPAYNIAVPLRLSGSLDVPALERALGEVVHRHEALRTVFGLADGSPVQRVVPFAGFRLPVTDLSPLPAEAREAAARRRADDDAARPFDLAAGPLFRATLLHLGGEEHVLLLAMHHAVSDGWSLGVIFRELWALYQAFAKGEAAHLPALPVQYADYAAWQRRELAGPVLEGQLGWWTERLAGAPVLLELPTDRPRPSVQGFAGGQVPVEVPTGLAARLRALGRQEGATPFMVLLAAFQVLLGKYAGSDDVVVGTPIAARTVHEVEGVVGFFANTLALRTDVSGDPAFREVLRRVREATLAAYEHQHVPFEKLVAELHLERSLAHSPLFQVMFVLAAAEPRRDDPAGLRVEEAAGGAATTKFDLTLGLADEGDSFRGSLAYRTDLFDGDTAARMARHLVRLLERVAGEPGRPLSALSLLDDSERRLLDAWNDTATPDPADRCIHALFEAQAARTPDAPAVAHRGRTITYRELDARANRLARLLRRRGVGPESRVGVCLERGVEMVAAVLAVLKAGGAYVPLDPAYPARRLAFVARDAGMEVLVTQASLRGSLPIAGAVSVLAVDEAAGELAAESPDPLDGGAVPGNLCYVIYTSGSTGRPKGVGVGHREAASYLAWAGRLYPTHGSVVHSPLSFDLTVTSLFVPLLNGGCVELVDDEAGVEALARRLERGGTVGMLKLTPAHLRVLGERLDGRVGAGGAACLVVGGEALLGEHLAWWRRQLPESVLVNEYGPTETVVGCCVHVCPLGDVADGAVPIGRPVANTRLHVLDPAGRRVPVGVPGELYIGGAQVTRGYLGRPALTAARFLPDRFSAGPGARLYRTGDRVRWRADGTLEYLGRLDEQVKVRGFRIEPGEVEAAVRRHPGVADCAVLARPGAGGEARLAAYVAGGFDAEALREHLRRELPEYMVPALVAVDALPLTPSGKLDHRALPAPAAEAAGGPAGEPETEVEARIAALWTELLGVAPRVDDNFFDLGGHSLLLVRMQARLAAELGHTVPVVELFQFSSVRTLAARLRGNGDTGAVALGEAQGGARQAAADRRLEARRRRNG